MVRRQLLLPLDRHEVVVSKDTVPLIDEEFDVEFADALARLESYNKHLYRPNTYLHKWWARRCGSTFRAILKHLQSSQEGIDYYEPEGLKGLVVLDPMMGGGTTLHEAIRLGANVVGADIDPIPILQARASLSQLPLPTLKHAFGSFYAGIQSDVGKFFKTVCRKCGAEVDAKFYLYASRQECDCGEAWIVDSNVLRHNADGSTIRICSRCHSIVDEGECHCRNSEPQPPIVRKGVKVCEWCGSQYRERLDLPFYERYALIAVVGECSEHGLFFSEPNAADWGQIRDANRIRGSLDFGNSEDFAVEPGPKSRDLTNHGISSYLELFSSRQLMYLAAAIARLEHYEPLVQLNLALLISTSLEFNSMLCGYKGAGKRRPGAVRHAFSYHAYTLPYTALENNPVIPQAASGTLRHLFGQRISKARTWALNPVERRVVNGRAKKITIRGEVDAGVEVGDARELASGDHKFLLLQGSSRRLDLPDGSVDHVVTDPPYFDSVQYSDLAAYFRVWLQRMLPNAADWDYDIEKSAVDPQSNRSGQYTRVLGAIFEECNRVLRRESGRMIFTFHHWDPKGWAALTKALKHGGFVLVNRYVVHSENPASVHILNLNALKHDAILVFAPTDVEHPQIWARPLEIRSDDSRSFCEDCATYLGWMLDADLGDEEIEKRWQEALGR
ncbi:MAG: hypothetical protein ACP5JG_07065 [Anaerolineae bacterium]